MCELKVVVTPEKFLELSGYSLQGFLDWKKSNAVKPAKKQTREDWLNQHRDCAHCRYDGKCSSQKFGYYQPRAVVSNGNHNDVVNNGPHYNMRMAPKGYSSCCRWNGEVANSLHDEADRLAKEGVLL